MLEREYCDEEQNYVAAPTQAMAMRWLREAYNIFIGIDFNRYGNNYKYHIVHNPVEIEDVRGHNFYTYEDACEAAIKYCLENLI